MGCDGGTIPRRDELVRLKKKPEQVSKHFYFLSCFPLKRIIHMVFYVLIAERQRCRAYVQVAQLCVIAAASAGANSCVWARETLQ